MGKRVKISRGRLHVVGLPGKSIRYVTDKTADDDAYNVERYDSVLIHLGAVDCLNILQGKDWSVADDIVYRFKDLHTEIRKLNQNCYIIISGILPIPDFYNSALVKKVNAMVERIFAHMDNTIFISGASLFTYDNQIIGEYFYKDRVHLNDDGVEVLRKFFSQSISRQDILNKLHSKRRKSMSRLDWWRV